MNYDEFLDKYEDKLEQGILENGCIGDFFDMVLEMASSTKREIDSRLRKLYSHMLKYQFQKTNIQSTSWIKTIREQSRELNAIKENEKNVWNKIDNEVVINQYKKALMDASTETGMSISSFPFICPEEWTLDNISDSGFIEKFLIDNAYSYQAKKYLYLI